MIGSGSPTIVTRFAPSPTGYLHLGHAHSALLAWRRAREAGGRFLVRLEDIDATRCRAEFADAALADLAWLGIDWDGALRRQSAHFADYRRALDRLEGLGLVYPCFCTRAAIQAEIARAGSAPHGPEGPLYPGTCRGRAADERRRRIAAGEAFALRLMSGARSPASASLTGSTSRRGVSGLIPQAMATSCSPARRCRPATISPSLSTTRCRA